MKKNLQSLGLILLMLVAGSGMKVLAADLIALNWNVNAGDVKEISLVTSSADAEITVNWADESEGGTYKGSIIKLQHTYENAVEATATIVIRVSGEYSILELDCSGQGITSIYLAGMPNVTKLDLSDNEINEPMDLKTNTELLYLDYSNNLLGQSSRVLDLSENAKLKVLNLSNNGLDDAHIPQLNGTVGEGETKVLEALEVLNLSNNNFTSQADLSGNTTLKELDYSDNTALTGLNVAGLTSLEKVNVSGNTSLEDLYLDGCSSLTSLDISGTGSLANISTEGVADGQITDFSSEGTNLDGDKLADLKDKVYTVTTTYTVALKVGAGIELLDYTSGNLQIEEDGHLFLQFLPETEEGEVLLLIDGVETEYTKNETGYSTYILNPIEKDYSVELYLKAYSVSFPTVDGIMFEGEGTAEYGQPYTFKMILDDTIDSETINVYVNDQLVEPDPLRSTTYTVTIDEVTGPIVVRVETGTVGIQPITTCRVYSLSGTLVVETTQMQAVQVYNLTGKQAFARTVNGTESIALTPGVYIVRVGREVQKIVVR